MSMQRMRKELNQLVTRVDTLCDKNIIKLSQELDKYIVLEQKNKLSELPGAKRKKLS